MIVRSLGLQTDLLFIRFAGQVTDRGSYLVAEIPANPTYYWGNFLAMEKPPRPGDFRRWTELFEQELGGPSGVGHMTFTWDSVEGGPGDVAPFLAAGFSYDESVVLTASSVRKPAKLDSEVQVRPLVSDADWEAASQNQVACELLPLDGAPSFVMFKRRQMAMYRAMADAGLGYWFGAFLGERLVGDLGLYRDGYVGRFQSVGTHPGFRRRGICGAMVFAVSSFALERMGLETLVMSADERYHAALIYETVGFRPAERNGGLCHPTYRQDQRRRP
ncbi:MAG: GNAT family N-acetyltransferase [Candidatus Schekmanbacteria bacterium]|nr:GNAT family N-acetyltransferase [Candidatus Schekmanbacteria bacterium]